MDAALHAAREALRRHFGHDDFRAGQIDVIRSVLSGADTLGVLPTGGGKSLCYQVPALLRAGATVVISPLISLMQDQVDRLASLGIAATYLNSTLEREESRRRLALVERGAVTLVYAAPERFGSPDLLDALARGGVGLLAVDEAHCISEWGHEFRPSFRRIALAAERFRALQVVALTATATPSVRRDIVEQLRLKGPRVVVGGFDRPNLTYAVTRCRTAQDKHPALVAALRAHPGLAVVYACTRGDVVSVARQLTRGGIAAAAYHGALPHAARLAAQDAFMRERVRAIVATSAFGMGIDKPNVRLVVHYALPGTLEAYYQEAGRAGRDGEPGHCVLLHAPHDRSTHDWFIRHTFPPEGAVRQVLAAVAGTRRGERVADVAIVARQARVTPADADAAMQWLERSGALVRGGGGGEVRARLLATPRRIAAELPPQSAERAVLRVLWRHAEGRVLERFTVPAGALGATPARGRRLLEALRNRQLIQFECDADALFVAQPTPAPEQLAGPLRMLARRRAAASAKLEHMLRFANTRECRRALVLAYFGERPATSRCGGCDNCRSA